MYLVLMINYCDDIKVYIEFTGNCKKTENKR